MILSDGVIGQMMEKVVLPPVKPRRTEEEIAKECPWATIGRPKSRPVNIMTSLELKPEVMEARNIALQEKYQKIRDTEVRYEMEQMEDADYVIVAFGSAARIAEKSIENAESRASRWVSSVLSPSGLSPRRNSMSWQRPRRAFWLPRSMPVRWFRMYAWL